MPNLKFIRDLWWLNTSSITDNLGNVSSPVNNLCKALQTSDSTYIQTAVSSANFYFRSDDMLELPEEIYWELEAATSELSNIKVYINDVQIIDTTFGASISFFGTFTPTSEEVQRITKGRSYINYDLIKVEITNFNGSNSTLGYLSLQYNNTTGKVSNNHESISNPTIRYAYPNSMSSSNWSGYTNLAFPTSSSANDSSPITQLSELTSSSCLNLNCNLSGSFGNTTRIKRAFLNIRYNQSGSNLPVARTDFCAGYIVPSGFTLPTMWGKGFIIHPSSSGYLVGTMPLYFTKDAKPDRYFNDSSYYNNFSLKFAGLPSGMKISAAEVLFYEEPDMGFNMFLNTGNSSNNSGINFFESGSAVNSFNSINFNSKGSISLTEETKYPVFDPNNFSSGKNRFKSVNSSGLFNIGFWDFKPSGVASNTNISGILQNTNPDFWHNYFIKNISSHADHNHAYNNSLFLKNNTITLPNVTNIDGDFSILVQVSSSGNSYNYFGNTGNVLTKYDDNNEREFELNCLGNIFEIVLYNISGQYTSFELPASSNNQILITNQYLGSGIHYTKAAYSNGTNNFIDYPGATTERNRSSGNIVLFSGFYGYIHELGIADSIMDYNFFNNTRHNYHEYLRGSGIYINIPKKIGQINTDYTLAFDSAQTHNENFVQFIPNPSSIYLDISYKNVTDNQSGIKFSGIYYNTGNFSATFSKTLPSGTGSTRIYADTFVLNHPETASGNRYDYLNFHLYENLLNKYIDLNIDSVSVGYQGYEINSRSSGYIDMYTNSLNRPSASIDFYENAKIVQYSTDFITKGHLNTSSGMNMFLNTIILPTPSGNFNMFAKGQLVQRAALNISVSGTTPETLTSNFPLAIRSLANSGVFNTVGLYSFSELNTDTSINLSIKNDKETLLDSINFMIKSDTVYNKSLEMSILNNNSGIYRPLLLFQATSPSGLNGSINMGIS